MTKAPAIGIVGATGTTGTYAFDVAQQRGLTPLAIGRNRGKLASFLAARGLGEERMRVADIHDARSLRRSLEGVAAVISTVAPYAEHGFPVAQAAAELGIGYTDSTGEGGFMMRLVAELDELAIKTGASLCTGNGTVAFIGDIAMQWLTDRSPQSSGKVLYDISGLNPTFGTLKSYITSIVPAGGPLVVGGRVEYRPLGAFSSRACGLPGVHSVVPDPLVISRYWPAKRLEGLFLMPAWQRPLIQAASSAMSSRPIRALLMRLPLERMAPYRADRDEQARITVHCEVITARGEVRTKSLTGTSIYRLAGVGLVSTVQAMIQNKARPTGVRAASEMFPSLAVALQLSGIREQASL